MNGSYYNIWTLYADDCPVFTHLFLSMQHADWEEFEKAPECQALFNWLEKSGVPREPFGHDAKQEEVPVPPERTDSPYSGMSYLELRKAMKYMGPGRDARMLHRELKKYGDGVPFHERHPILHLLFMVAISILTALLTLKLVGVI